jgi:hypothetical protein
MRTDRLFFVMLLSTSLGLRAESLANAWDNAKSPVTTDAKYVPIVGAGLVGVLLLFKDDLNDTNPNLKHDSKTEKNLSKMGDAVGHGFPNALYTAGMLGYGWMSANDRAVNNGSSMMQASVYSLLVTGTLKYTVREPRPRNFNERDSFPSGHSTLAASFASYVGCRHSLPWGIAAAGLGTLAVYNRIHRQKHYWHDIAGGLAIGSAYGLGICLAENRRSEKDAQSQSLTWYLAPTEGTISAGFNLALD